MVRRELAKFDEWAATNPRPDGRPWEVAVLTFYRGQERELRQELRRWSGLHHARGRFLRGPKAQPYLAVDLCTVDRFQGHEADLVILSIAKSRATYFLESPNRWNVALTRARYQRVIVGNRHGFSRASGLLGELARDPSWEQSRPEGQV
jgi:superfamily I DNA and/or RNA helicase